jgi:hypothetical protein
LRTAAVIGVLPLGLRSFQDLAVALGLSCKAPPLGILDHRALLASPLAKAGRVGWRGHELGAGRKESGNRMYIMTARRMTSGDVLKYRNGFFMPRGCGAPI